MSCIQSRCKITHVKVYSVSVSTYSWLLSKSGLRFITENQVAMWSLSLSLFSGLQTPSEQCYPTMQHSPVVNCRRRKSGAVSGHGCPWGHGVKHQKMTSPPSLPQEQAPASSIFSFFCPSGGESYSQSDEAMVGVSRVILFTYEVERALLG